MPDLGILLKPADPAWRKTWQIHRHCFMPADGLPYYNLQF
jgi:hypothetical protein